MQNREIATLLRRIAAAYIVLKENPFKIRAYEVLADSLENSTDELEDLWKENKLYTVQGIGKSLEGHLNELFTKGHVAYFDKICSKVPEAMFPLLEVPGFGAKKAYKLASILRLKHSDTAINDLLDAARSGKIASIEGFGTKSQQDIIEAIKRFKKGQVKENRMVIAYAYTIVEEMREYLLQNKHVKTATPLGSVRRGVETVGDLDIGVATLFPKEVIEWFLHFPKKRSVIEKGPTGASIILTNGRQIDMRVQTPNAYGAMLQYFTGSKSHNIKLREYALKKGFSLSEYGIKLEKRISNFQFPISKYNKKKKLYEYSKEEDFYNAVGLPWIPPELREDRGEIEAAINGQMPRLIELSNIKGDFHIHSNYNLEPSHDLGSSSLQDILNLAHNLHYDYIGISDHNPSHSHHTKNNIIQILKDRKSYLEQIKFSLKSVRTHLFTMLEIDILPDGRLAIPEEAFEFLDFAIASIHSNFAMSKGEMTRRIIHGLSHPKVKILGHPTGRLIGKRVGYEIDWDAVFAFCKTNNKALEINAYPERLDLPDTLVKKAIEAGVKLVIGTDSHDSSSLNLMKYGITVARRGWAEKDDIVNTFSYNKLLKWLYT